MPGYPDRKPYKRTQFAAAFGGGFGGQQHGGQYGPFTYTYSTNGGADFDFGGFSDPFEIFEQFFGGASPFGQRARRSVYSLTITFMEAAHGVEKQVTINGKQQKIKVPAGVDQGSRIRFDDYDIVVNVMPDRNFAREGADIISEKEVLFTQAILGDEVEIETIDGPLKIRIPPGIQPGTLIRLSSRGVPRLRGSGRGDHYIKIKVSVPKKITKHQKELLEEFQREEQSGKKWF